MDELCMKRFNFLADDVKKIIIAMISDKFMGVGIKTNEIIMKKFNENDSLKMLLENNVEFWISLWVRYISDKIPTTNLNQLKLEYADAIDIYTMKFSNWKEIWEKYNNKRHIKKNNDKKNNEDNDGKKGKKKRNWSNYYYKSILDNFQTFFNDKNKMIRRNGYNKMLKIMKLNDKLNVITKTKRHVNKIKKLVDKGADVNHNNFGINILYKAIYDRNYNLIQYLKENDVEVNSICTLGYDHFFLSLKKYKFIEITINLGMNVNIQGDFGHTLLDLTIMDMYTSSHQKKQLKIVKLLMSNGADPNIRNRDNKNIFDLISNATPSQISPNMQSQLLSLITQSTNTIHS